MENSKIRRWITILASIFILLILTCVVSLSVGSAGIPLNNMWNLLLMGEGTTEYAILFQIRLPRIFLGFAVGGALSLAGAILQGMFRNPLVEPYTLGISGGASLGVCLNIVFKWYTLIGVIAYPISGFLGSTIVIMSVYSLTLKKGFVKSQGMLLIGVMISFISSSLVMLLMAVSGSEEIHGIIMWIMGSLDEPNMMLIKIAVLGSLAGLCMSYCYCMDLNALTLGDEEALHLGINVERTKRRLFLIASVLTGFSVSVAGIIGFVGLVVPHFLRMFTGTDHRILFVTSYFGGACFLILCDTLARTVISPLELPVGVITGIIGGTIFIYTLSRKQVVL